MLTNSDRYGHTHNARIITFVKVRELTFAINYVIATNVSAWRCATLRENPAGTLLFSLLPRVINPVQNPFDLTSVVLSNCKLETEKSTCMVPCSLNGKKM